MATNLWINPSLEDGITGWSGVGSASVSQSSTQAWDLANSLKVTTTSTAYGGTTTVPMYGVEESTDYVLSFYLYNTDGGETFRFEWRDQDSNWISPNKSGQSSTQDTWVRHFHTVTTGAGDTGMRIKITKENTATAFDFYLDGFQLESGTTPSTWEDYYLTTRAAKGALTIADYNATVSEGAGAAAGDFYLFEEFAADFGLGIHDFSSGGNTFKAALINDTLAPTQAASAAWGTFSANEVSGTGYSAGGATLASQSYNEVDGVGTFDADDVEWSMNAAGPTDARYLVIYNDSDATTPKATVGWMDLGGDVSLRQGDIVAKWAGTGIHRFTYADLS